MAETNFTLPVELRYEIEGADCISQSSCEAISGMADAIERPSADRAIQAMATHIKYLANDIANTVNCAAESLGANYKG